MKKIFLSAITTCALAILAACSSADGFKAASLGCGAKAGQDYVTGLSPSAVARQYFARIGTKAPIETLTKANAARSKSGVRFVDNDGILIPAGVTIQFTNKGYCLDPKLPAPVADEEYQLVPVSALIPTELQGIYSNLVRKAAAGDTNVKNNMQRLVWALRTAGTDASYANNLSATQKSILDSCSSRPGEFESVHNGAKATSMLMDKVWSMADSIGSVRVAGRSYRASDFRSTASLENAVGSHLNNLLLQGKNLPIQRTGFNFGELQPGIYTDVRGAGFLAFTAKIANATNQDFIFYPGNYVGQVGSGSALSSFASSNNTRRQRVSMGPVEQVNVIDKREPDEQLPDDVIQFKDQSCAEKSKQIEMAALAAAVYGDSPFAETLLRNKGYEMKNKQVALFHGTSALYVKNRDKSIYIVFRGTDNRVDIGNDVDMFVSPFARSYWFPRFAEALKRTKNAIKEYPDYSITLVGHSLGGSVVQHVMNNLPSNNIKAYTFNSYGLPRAERVRKTDNRIIDIVNGNEFVSELLKNSRISGKKIIVDSAFHANTPTNIIDRGFQHKMAPTITNMLYASRDCK